MVPLIVLSNVLLCLCLSLPMSALVSVSYIGRLSFVLHRLICIISIRTRQACITGIAPHTLILSLQLPLQWPQLLQVLQLQLLRIRRRWALRRRLVSISRLVARRLRKGCRFCRLRVPSMTLVTRVELV